MAQALPLTKLASLLVKTLAKPLSKRIKHDFSRFDMTKRLLVNIGQTNHTVTSYMQIWSSGYRVRSIKPLDKDKALKDGAEFVGETFIFGVSVGLLLWEYKRSSESNEKKASKKRQEIRREQAQLQAKLHALDVRLKAVEDAVKEQTDTMLGISLPQPVGKRKKYQPPPEKELVDIDAPIVTHEQQHEADQDESNDQGRTDHSETDNRHLTRTHQRDDDATTETPDQPWWKFW